MAVVPGSLCSYGEMGAPHHLYNLQPTIARIKRAPRPMPPGGAATRQHQECQVGWCTTSLGRPAPRLLLFSVANIISLLLLLYSIVQYCISSRSPCSVWWPHRTLHKLSSPHSATSYCRVLCFSEGSLWQSGSFTIFQFREKLEHSGLGLVLPELQHSSSTVSRNIAGAWRL